MVRERSCQGLQGQDRHRPSRRPVERLRRSVAKELKTEEHRLRRCPGVRRHSRARKNGTLAVMVACPKATFDALEDTIKTFGKVFFVGEGAGQAQTLKLANNLIAAAVIALSSEALAMGVKAGLDPKVMCDVINVSSGRNSATQDKFPKSVLTGTFDFGFASGLSCKDVRLCVDEAEAPRRADGRRQRGAPVPRGHRRPSSARSPDFTNMARVVEEWAGVGDLPLQEQNRSNWYSAARLKIGRRFLSSQLSHHTEGPSNDRSVRRGPRDPQVGARQGVR